MNKNNYFNGINEFKEEYVFNKFDLDQDGLIDIEEIQLALIFMLGIELDIDSINYLYKTLFYNYKSDNNVMCNYLEFCELAKSIKNKFIKNQKDFQIEKYIQSFDDVGINYETYYVQIKLKNHLVSDIDIAKTFSYLSNNNFISCESIDKSVEDGFFQIIN